MKNKKIQRKKDVRKKLNIERSKRTKKTRKQERFDQLKEQMKKNSAKRALQMA